MGICQHTLIFQTAIPSLSCIANQITEISGLPIVIQEFSGEDSSTLYSMRAQLAFKSSPNNPLEIYADRNPQTVNLRIYLGQEETLFFVMIFALEKLGGTLTRPIPTEINDQYRQKYQQKITPFQLTIRSLQVAALVLAYWIVGILAIPILIPFWILKWIRSPHL
jgi:hypothetical protein